MSAYQQGQPITITDSFTDAGVPNDPTTLVYSVEGPDGTITTYTWPGAPEISNPAVGDFELALSPPALPGLYKYDVDATGAVTASRSATFYVIPNAVTGPAVAWAVEGPCSPWCSSQDVWDCCGQPTTLVGEGSAAVECPVDMTQYAMEASTILYELSGRLYSGLCERTVRPCGTNWCGFQVLSRGHIVWPEANGYYWGWDGYRWRYPQFTGCGCQPLSRVLLAGYPVREILEVKIDGAVVAADTYRLDERRYLTRVRDPADPDTVLLWPNCQAMDMEDTEVGTWSVTYQYGQDPPLVGIHAASQLACELYRACTGAACSLPAGTTRVTRQGVQIDKLATLAWIRSSDGWRTGLSLVDVFLASTNMAGLVRRPVMWSPDGPRYARGMGQ